MMPFILWGWVMQDFKLLTRQLLETYLGSDTLSDVAIQDFLDSNASIIGTGKQEFFKNIENFLNSFKFDVEKRKNIHLIMEMHCLLSRRKQKINYINSARMKI